MKRLTPAIFLLTATIAFAADPPAKFPFYRQGAASASVAGLQASNDPVVVNAASYLPGVSPGGLATVFGRDLSNVSDIVVASGDRLPTVLAGVSVIVNGLYAGLFSVAYANGQDQISFQVPWETPTGPGSARIEVLFNGNSVARIQTDSFVEDPGIFIYPTDSGNYAVALRPDFTLIGPRNPAGRGEILVLYTTGLGPVSLNLPDGVRAPSDPLAYTQDPFQVILDGERCDVLFSGLAPGFVGLYQLNFRVPFDARAGNLDLQIQSPFANSGVATLPVF